MQAGAVALLVALFGTVAEAKVLHWNDARELGLRNSQALLLSKNEVEMAQTAVDRGYSPFFPKLSTNLTGKRLWNEPSQEGSNSYVLSLDLEQSLFSSGKDYFALKQASALLDATKKRTKLESIRFRAVLRLAWNDSIYLSELENIYRGIVNRREANKKMVQMRYSGGREDKGSFMKSEALAMESIAAQGETQSRKTAANLKLANLIGEHTTIETEGRLEQIIDLDKVLQMMNTKAAEVSVAQSELLAAEASIQQSRARYLPEIGFAASAAKVADTSFSFGEPVYSATLRVQMPLFDYSKNADFKAALHTQAKAAIQLTEVQSSVQQLRLSRKLEFESATLKQQAAEKLLQASKIQAEVARRKYALGLLSFQEWNAIESEQTQSELEELRARKNSADAIANLFETCGLTLEDDQ